MECWGFIIDWDNDITNQLPAPRDDEPASLRQDIIDEISDHLQLSLLREQHKTTNETEARQNVLSRFGNPASIAYQLWFDALKEKIMSQRITLAFSALIAIACFVAVGLVWNMTNKSQELNLAILEQLKAKPTAQQKSMEWNPVKVKLKLAGDEGKPAEEYRVTLQGNLWRTGRGTMIDKKTNKEGLVNLGLVQPGRFIMHVYTPWGEFMKKMISVSPGSAETFEIICPDAPREKAKMKITLDLPKDIQGQGLWFGCSVYRRGRKINDAFWHNPESVSDSEFF